MNKQKDTRYTSFLGVSFLGFSFLGVSFLGSFLGTATAFMCHYYDGHSRFVEVF